MVPKDIDDNFLCHPLLCYCINMTMVKALPGSCVVFNVCQNVNCLNNVGWRAVVNVVEQNDVKIVSDDDQLD